MLTLMCLFVSSRPHVYPPTWNCQLGLQRIPLDLLLPPSGVRLALRGKVAAFTPSAGARASKETVYIKKPECHPRLEVYATSNDVFWLDFDFKQGESHIYVVYNG